MIKKKLKRNCKTLSKIKFMQNSYQKGLICPVIAFPLYRGQF